MSRLTLPVAAALSGLLMATDAGAAPNAKLRALCAEYWKGHLAAHPVTATSLGVHGYDDQLDDPRPAAVAREEKRLKSVLDRARAIPEASITDPDDRLNRAALIEEVQGALSTLRIHFEEWTIDAQNGPQVGFNNLPDITSIATPEDGRHYLARLEKIPGYFDAHVANLKRGLSSGRTATHDAVRRTIAALDELLKQDAKDWPMASPAKAAHDAWPAAEREAFRREVPAVVGERVVPAYRRFREFLATQVMPKARPAEKAGLMNLPGGLAAYQSCIRLHTSLDKDPAAIHEIGKAEVAKFRADLAMLGKKVLGTGDIAEIQKRLRGDSAMHFRNAQEVESTARATLARAQAATPQWFGIQPKAPCEVRVMGMHEAPNSTIAYYREPAADGSRPGVYMINTYLPTTRPRYEAEALAFHESVPGHHLQIAIQQELTGIPDFRKYQGVTAFVEGWALYTERLADEMNLYSGDLDRMGMLSFDAWRDCRLVVDSGIHAMGWSRQQAIDYMKENTLLAENNIENEVDRYISWPGQALAYKLGQLEILRLRDDAKKRMGERFDIKGFHDIVLRNGAVALPVLEAEVKAWAAAPSAAR